MGVATQKLVNRKHIGVSEVLPHSEAPAICKGIDKRMEGGSNAQDTTSLRAAKHLP